MGIIEMTMSIMDSWSHDEMVGLVVDMGLNSSPMFNSVLMLYYPSTNLYQVL